MAERGRMIRKYDRGGWQKEERKKKSGGRRDLQKERKKQKGQSGKKRRESIEAKRPWRKSHLFQFAKHFQYYDSHIAVNP